MLALLWRWWWRLHLALLTLLRRWRRWLHLTLLALLRRWRWRLHLALLTLLWRWRLHLTLLWRARPLWRLFLLFLFCLRRLGDHEHAIEWRCVC